VPDGRRTAEAAVPPRAGKRLHDSSPMGLLDAAASIMSNFFTEASSGIPIKSICSSKKQTLINVVRILPCTIYMQESTHLAKAKARHEIPTSV
jgi:hypothetical protein